MKLKVKIVPQRSDYNLLLCPKCDADLSLGDELFDKCPKCGQELKWHYLTQEQVNNYLIEHYGELVL